MIQVIDDNGPCWSARFVAGAPQGSRVARATQSAAAADLLDELRAATGIVAGTSSKAHSRALAAAALAQTGVVGIDVEHFTPGRPIRAIARWLMGAEAGDDAAAYRAFTFREAYFKAIGGWPDPALLRAAAEAPETRYSAGGMQVLHETVGADFLLTLVWRR